MATFLVVEDSDEMRETLAEMIRSAGHAAIEAKSVNHALEMAKTAGIGCVVLDLHLFGGRNGLELAKEIRAMPECAKTAIVMLTGTSVNHAFDRTNAAEYGVDCWLMKPVGVSGIVERGLELIREKNR